MEGMVSSKYDLIANICHDSFVRVGESVTLTSNSASTGASAGTKSVLDNGCYRIHLQNKVTEQWFELQDLHVSETMPQLIGLSESYMLVYERKDVAIARNGEKMAASSGGGQNDSNRSMDI